MMNCSPPSVGAFIDERVEQRDERFAAFEAETLLPDVARVQELLELLGGDQLEQDLLGCSSAVNCGRLRIGSIRC